MQTSTKELLMETPFGPVADADMPFAWPDDWAPHLYSTDHDATAEEDRDAES
jgi:hypothetical protein